MLFTLLQMYIRPFEATVLPDTSGRSNKTLENQTQRIEQRTSFPAAFSATRTVSFGVQLEIASCKAAEVLDRKMIDSQETLSSLMESTAF